MDDVVVNQLMATPVATVSEDDSIDDAAAQMLEGYVGSLVVVSERPSSSGNRTESDDEKTELVGILTATDCVGIVAEGAGVAETPVREFMTSDPITTTPDESIRAVADRMLEHGVHHVPVVEDGETVGVITTTDLTAFLSTTRPPSP
jgi:CBS domain-containing protein